MIKGRFIEMAKKYSCDQREKEWVQSLNIRVPHFSQLYLLYMEFTVIERLQQGPQG